MSPTQIKVIFRCARETMFATYFNITGAKKHLYDCDPKASALKLVSSQNVH